MTVSPTAAPPYPNAPVVETNLALVCLVINVFLPGIGTIVAGVVGNKPMIGRGIAQLLLAIILVGWIWALVTGIQLVQNATWNDRRPKASA